MNIEKVASVVEKSVSGIRVKVMRRGRAELEELKVVFDGASPYYWLCDKVRGLMEKHGLHNTHGYEDGEGNFTMTYARATSFGVEILEREAKRGDCMMKEIVLRQKEILRGHLPPAKHEPSGSKAAWGAILDYYLNHRYPSPRNLKLAYDEMMKDFRDGRRLYEIGDWKLVFKKEFGHDAPKTYPKGWVPKNAAYKKVIRVLLEAKFISALS